MTTAKANGSPAIPSAKLIQDASRIGILLVGGKSRRMGQDKNALLFRGRKLSEFMKGIVGLAVGPKGIVLESGRNGIPDRQEDQGPLSGVDSVLHYLRDQKINLDGKVIFIVPVDMPGLTPDLLRPLAPGEGEIARAYDGYALPMGLRFNAANESKIFDTLDKLLRADAPAEDHSFKELERRIEARKLKLPRGQAPRLLNVNTPEEWAQALKEFGR